MHKRGVTLIELLIVLGIASFAIAMGAALDFGGYFASVFRNEQDTLLVLLQKARSDALTNIDGSAHGVAIYPADHPHAYVLFAGDTYASDPATHQVFERSPEDVVDAMHEITFQALSGNSSFEGTLLLTDPHRGIAQEIDINYEGAISW